VSSNEDRTERLRAFAMEDTEEATSEARLAKRALEAGDVAEARRRLSRVVGLATEAGSALLVLQLEEPKPTN
jgi:uncharacterized membrane-anchored protein